MQSERMPRRRDRYRDSNEGTQDNAEELRDEEIDVVIREVEYVMKETIQ